MRFKWVSAWLSHGRCIQLEAKKMKSEAFKESDPYNPICISLIGLKLGIKINIVNLME